MSGGRTDALAAHSGELTKLDERLRCPFRAWLQQSAALAHTGGSSEHAEFEELYFGHSFGTNEPSNHSRRPTT